MVLLTPKFVLVALLASFTAFSLAPTADAAAIAVRHSHQRHLSELSEVSSGSPPSHANHPVLPLPARLMSPSGKAKDRSMKRSDGSMKRQSPRDFFAPQRRSLTLEDLPPLLTGREPPHHEPHQSHENAPSPGVGAQQFIQEESEARPFVRINGANSHVAFDRRAPYPLPDPHHRHGHHHHVNHDHHHGSKHADDVVVVEGDNDNIHIGQRSSLPDPPRNHHYLGRPLVGNEMASGKQDNDISRRSPRPRHDHHHDHHHHGHGNRKGDGPDKVIVKGDDNDVTIHSRSRILRRQRRSYLSELPETTSYHHHAHSRMFVPLHQPNHSGGSPTDHAELDKSSKRSDKDQTVEYPRSVLINSIEGEEKYLVPDDYQDQRVNVIEEDGVSSLAKAKRGDPGIEGVPGSVEIMSQTAKSEDGQRIASLVLVQPDSTMAEFGNNTFVLNASENNHTQLYMVALNMTDSGVQGEDVPVALKVSVFNPDSASMEGYCATYDPEPPAPAPLSAEPCFYDEPTGPHKSQVFAYTPSTSVIRPMWFGDETDEDTVDGLDSNSTARSDATVDPKTPLSDGTTSITGFGDFGNSTAPPSSIASFDNSTGISQGLADYNAKNDSMIPAADGLSDDFVARAQNVTLVFTPATPVIPSGSRTSTKDPLDLDDETSMSGSNSTSTDTSSGPVTSNAFGRFNDTETDWTGSPDDVDMPAASMPSSASVPSQAVSPVVDESEDRDLNVMVGVARDSDRSGGIGAQDAGLKAVNTAPYRWKFDRELVDAGLIAF